MRRLVAFTGPMGCGKSTAAGYLAYYGWQVASFASPLKRAAKDIFHLTEEQVATLAGKQAFDERWNMTSREILQKFGTEAMRETFPGVWVKSLELALAKHRHLDVVIDDLRFPDEEAMVRRLRGLVIHIRGRAADIVGEYSSHQSERGLAVQLGDLVFNNSGSLIEFKNQVISIL